MTPTEQLLRDALEAILNSVPFHQSHEAVKQQALAAIAATSQQADGDDGFESARRFLLAGLYESAPPSQAPEPAQAREAGVLLALQELAKVYDAMGAPRGPARIMADAYLTDAPAQQEAVPSNLVRVEETNAGVRLYIGGVRVNTWVGTRYAEEAHEIARQVRAAIASPVVSNEEIFALATKYNIRCDYRQELLEFARALARTAPVVAEWISVGDRLPAHNQMVIAISPRRGLHDVEWKYRLGRFFCGKFAGQLLEPTHWMPLPASPSPQESAEEPR